MEEFVEQTIEGFRGMISDARRKDLEYSQLLKNFDAHSFETKLVPFRDSENGDAVSATNQIQNFCAALGASSTWKLYGCGRKAGDTQKIFSKDPGTEFDDGDWTALTKGESAALAANFNLFHYYKKKSLIYGTIASRYVFTCDPIDSLNFAENIYDYGSAASHISQGLTHSKNDIMFFGMDNIVLKNNNNTTFVVGLTLPTFLYITSLTEYGEMLAIACAPVSGIGNSYVFLWDMNATSWNEVIDWGAGNVQILEQVEGKLVGISYVSSLIENAKIVFRQYAGSIATPFLTLRSEAIYSAGDLPIAKQKIDNYLYFLMTITLNGTKHQGLWKVGRESLDRNFALSFDRAANNDTALTATAALYNFFIYQDYVFISYMTGSAYTMSKTNDQASYTASSIVETLKIKAPKGKSGKLMCIGVMTDPLPSGGRIYLKYKKNAETSYTEIFDQYAEDTADADYQSIYHDAINIESSGMTLPTFKEISLQIVSKGKAIPTGWYYKYQIINDTNMD